MATHTWNGREPRLFSLASVSRSVHVFTARLQNEEMQLKTKQLVGTPDGTYEYTNSKGCCATYRIGIAEKMQLYKSYKVASTLFNKHRTKRIKMRDVNNFFNISYADYRW